MIMIMINRQSQQFTDWESTNYEVKKKVPSFDSLVFRCKSTKWLLNEIKSEDEW